MSANTTTNPLANEFIDGEVRHNWTANQVNALFNLPFNDLMFKAQTVTPSAL